VILQYQSSFKTVFFMAELVSVTLEKRGEVITKNAIEKSIEWQDARSNCY
jgi:hypothetical protein